MQIRTKLELIAALVVAALAVWLGSSYLAARDAKVRAEVTAETQKAAQAQFDAQIKLITDSERQFHQEQGAKLAALQMQFNRQVTPEQIAALVSQTMGLQKPIQIMTPAPAPENPKPEPVAQVPLVDAPQAKAYLQACETCRLNLATSQRDLDDAHKQNGLLQEKVTSAETERDAWKRAAKGGGFFANLKRSGKWFGIGAVAGAFALCGTGHCR